MGEGRSQRDLGKEGKVAKYKWTLRVDLVQDWRRSPRHEDAMNEVKVKWICVLHAKFTILKINYVCDLFVV